MSESNGVSAESKIARRGWFYFWKKLIKGMTYKGGFKPLIIIGAKPKSYVTQEMEWHVSYPGLTHEDASRILFLVARGTATKAQQDPKVPAIIVPS